MKTKSPFNDGSRGHCPGCLNGNVFECWSFAGSAPEHIEREKSYGKAKARLRRQERAPREDRVFRREE